MPNSLREEFRLKNFGFHHDKAEHFVTSQWKWHPWAFVGYRVIVALYSIACFLAVTLMSIGNKRSIMVFLTIWTYLVLCLYMIVAAVLALLHWCKPSDRTGSMIDVDINASDASKQAPTSYGIVSAAYEKDSDEKSEKEIPNGGSVIVSSSFQVTREVESGVVVETLECTWLMKLSWLLGAVVYVFGIVVTAVYFVALFPSIGVTAGFGNDLNMHAFNTVLILLDVAIVARPVRLLHVIYPVGYGVLYIIFSAVYWSKDKENNVLYENVLDWNHPGSTAVVIAVLAVIGLPLLQLMHFGLYRLRLVVYRKLHGENFV